MRLDIRESNIADLGKDSRNAGSDSRTSTIKDSILTEFFHFYICLSAAKEAAIEWSVAAKLTRSRSQALGSITIYRLRGITKGSTLAIQDHPAPHEGYRYLPPTQLLPVSSLPPTITSTAPKHLQSLLFPKTAFANSSTNTTPILTTRSPCFRTSHLLSPLPTRSN